MHAGRDEGAARASAPARRSGGSRRRSRGPTAIPGNADAIGIELVGAATPKPGGGPNDYEYETVTSAQQKSFDWLLPRLLDHFKVDAKEVFRHPDVSWKQPSEAASVRW